jgi:hypothetical protein
MQHRAKTRRKAKKKQSQIYKRNLRDSQIVICNTSFPASIFVRPLKPCVLSSWNCIISWLVTLTWNYWLAQSKHIAYHCINIFFEFFEHEYDNTFFHLGLSIGQHRNSRFPINNNSWSCNERSPCYLVVAWNLWF